MKPRVTVNHGIEQYLFARDSERKILSSSSRASSSAKLQGPSTVEQELGIFMSSL